jgi:hypothetical protein
MPKLNPPPKPGHLPLSIAILLLSTLSPVSPTTQPFHQPNPTNHLTLPTTQLLQVRFYNFY